MADDFFSNVALAASKNTRDDDSHDDFAHAISLRFGSADLRTARILPEPHTPLPSRPPPPPPGTPLPSVPPTPTFSSIPPSALHPLLADTRALILDVRPHAAYTAARVDHAISLSVPTTLLKRPLFSLAKLSQMLPSPSSRTRFAHWSSASRILVYDSDSTSDNTIITGLLRKFSAEGFTGELAWVRGGFQAVWREARDLATTEPPTPEEDDHDTTLRTTHLPKAAFSLLSTTAVPLPQLGTIPVPNTPAPSATRAANPFFDTIRQNVELSHGITERIPLRLPRRVRRRIHDLPFAWLQDIARRSALRRSLASRHPGFDSLESGSESSDDPYTSDPDENDPCAEEGAETFAMQFYRIELAEQRRLRSIMEHHTRESQVSGFAHSANSRRTCDRAGGVRTNSRTPRPTVFPFSITAAVEKGTKNRYTHIWPFEHARVRLHDARHQGSHPGRRDKGKVPERGRRTRNRSGGQGKEREEEQIGEQDNQRRSRSSPAFGKSQTQVMETLESSSTSFSCLGLRSSIPGTNKELEAGLAHPASPNVPRVKIEYDTTEQDSRMSGPPTPATAIPLPTPPFYTPMEIPLASTPRDSRPPQLLSLPSAIGVNLGGRFGGISAALPALSLPSLGPLPSSPLRLPTYSGGSLSGVGDQTWTLESPFSTGISFPSRKWPVLESVNDSGPRRAPSPADDYVNASYVQPLGTRKRYIATQGPLPSTYVDFWTLVWEQNVHVVVMLTREVENAVVKCGSYWTDTEYGPLRLELLSTFPPISPNANPSSADLSKQGFFAIREPQEKTSGPSRDQPTLITRTFNLSHTSYPGVPPRRITHLQYLDWSDMNVPDDPRGVLDLIRRVEQATAEGTPGPSPGGSLTGSLSGSQSPDVAPEQRGFDSLLSPTSAAVTPCRGRGMRGSEWRHPELDLKSGVATFALGKAAPVLLHCSAGVGRTGGFIAVDAVLDGIKRELRKRREAQLSGVTVVVSREDNAGVNGVEAARERSAEGMIDVDEVHISDEGERMDVDELAMDKPDTARDPLLMINTIPIPISAGDPKGRRRHNHDKDLSGQKRCSSPGSLVVHVPCAGTSAVPEGSHSTGIDLCDSNAVGWQPSSTREWVEQVSDQTHALAEEGDPPLPSSLLSRERSPGSTSNSSGPSALNSSGDSMNGSTSANASGSTGARANDDENGAERKSDTGSGTGTGSGRGYPPPSWVSKPGSGSLTLSVSGSGTGSGSRFGSSLLRAHLQDSSVTSISADSTDSLSMEPKPNASPHRPSAIHASPSFDMEIDHPPRPVSVPLRTTYSAMASHQRAVRSRHQKPMRVSSSAARFSSLPPGSVERGISPGDADTPEDSVSRPSSDIGSDELSPPREFENTEGADAGRCAKKSRVASDESGERAVRPKQKGKLRLNTELSSLRSPETLRSGGVGKEKAIPMAPRALDDPALQPAAGGHDQSGMDHSVVDYKLPRELHSDLSPPPISSFAEPICTIIQDMREQRMSLCQSLRQYVFVHAAIIEGALRIVDEERELWGYCGTNDDTGSAEGGSGTNVTGGRQKKAAAWFGRASEAEVTATRPEHDRVPNRARLLHTMTPLNPWVSEANIGGSETLLASTSSSSGVSSPSKGKRAPSPTELLREDKTGALSLNKRPSIQRKRTSYEGDLLSFEPSKSPTAGDDEGSRDGVVGVSGARTAQGRLAPPEIGSRTTGSAR